MNILVTGGLGFIGSHFIEEILKDSFFKNVINIDKATYAANHNLEFRNSKNYKEYSLDINDKDILNILKFRNIDLVAHFAAESHVDNSIKSSSEFITTNINGTHNLVEQCRLYGKVKKFLHVSTDEVFGSLGADDKPFTENSPYKPNNPYSASKASSDLIVRSYFKTHKFPAIITNCSNNFGARQFPEKLIPLAIKKLINFQQVPVYGDGKNVRDWIYVKDHVRFLIKAIKQGVEGEQYLVGGENEISNIDLIKLINKTINEDFKTKTREDFILFVEDRKSHDNRYAINNTGSEKRLGRINLTDFNSSLKETIGSYLCNR